MEKINLTPAQLQGVEFAEKCDFNCVFWWKQGEGKTRLALACAAKKKPEFLLIIAPKKVHSSWIKEIEEFPGILPPYRIHSSDSIEKLLHYNFRYYKGGSMIIVDELFYFANPASKRSKNLRRLTVPFNARIGLSGTIIPANNNEAIYGQLKCLHFERPLAGSLTEFRSRYRTHTLSDFEVQGRKIHQFEDTPGSYNRIMKKIQGFVHVNFPDNKHRKISDRTIVCPLNDEQKGIIKNLKTNFNQALQGEEIDFEYSSQVLHAICKLSNGYLEFENDYKAIENAPKVLKLLEILKDLHEKGERAVIWCAYRADVLLLQSISPYRSLRFWGSENFDETAWNSGEYPFVFATVSSGASVNHFKDVKHGVYFSLNYKLLNFLQSKGRHERGAGSGHEGAHYTYLLSDYPSIDQDIFNTLQYNDAIEKNFIIKLAKNFLKK